jgi:Leucine-rich repeat (LRR) protein
VPELKRLTFLKKLSIAENKIEKMWSLPSTLEFLNISHNLLSELDPLICQNLQNLKTIDISNNKITQL